MISTNNYTKIHAIEKYMDQLYINISVFTMVNIFGSS